MRLRIATPTAVVIDTADVVSVRAEDESGSFGILPGHVDFLTTLPTSVVAWRTASGEAQVCAVWRGLLTVQGGAEVIVSTREAHVGQRLEDLEAEVLVRYRAEADEERAASTAAARLRMQTIRRIVQSLRAGARVDAGFEQ